MLVIVGQTTPPVLPDLPKPNPDARPDLQGPVEENAAFGIETRDLTLDECLCLGEKHQPRILGVMASLRAAEIACEGIHSLRGVARLAPDLSVRKQQSLQGVEIARAVLRQEIEDTKYAIRRSYFTTVYATIQADRVRKLIAAMERTSKEINKQLTQSVFLEMSGVNTRLRLAIAEARNQLAVAEIGRLKARFLLLEEMGGLKPLGFLPEPADKRIPRPQFDITLDKLESLVQDYRGERIMARAARDVAHLEVDAQRQSSRFQFINRTFAAYSDNGVNPIPTPQRGEEYRPGAMSLEMSTHMGGPKSYRVWRSEALAERADWTEVTTRNLTHLEARIAYLNLREINRRLEADRMAIDDARQIYERTTQSTIRIYDVDVLPRAVMLLVDYEKLRLERALVAAEMMRITGGALEIPYGPPGGPGPEKPEASTELVGPPAPSP